MKMLLRTLLLSVSLLHLLRRCFPFDNVTLDRPIKDGDVLTSNGGRFALGFFSPGKSSRRYVGIWYIKVSVQSLETIVWVANREDPIDDSSGVLSMAQDGNLIISRAHENITLWSTNVSATGLRSNGKIQGARLLDSGNLILVSAGGGESRVAWQSFDHPTHTFLPGMKIGLDKRTGLNRFLTSWKSDDDPALGNYSFRVEPHGSPQFFLYMGSTLVWSTGPWLGGKWSGVPDMTHSFIFNYSFVDTPDEITAVYYVLNPSIITTFLLDGTSGTVQRQTWQGNTKRWFKFWSEPKENCDNYGRCGAYGECNPNSGNQFECSCFPGYEPKSPKDWYLRDGTQGCKRKREGNVSMCGNGEGFLKLSNVKVPDTVNASVDMSVSSLKGCEEQCLKNCSCTGYTSADGRGGKGCLAYSGELIDTREYVSGGQDIYFRVDRVELAKHLEKAKRYKRLVVGLSVSAALLLVGLASFLYWYWIKTKKEREKQREILGWMKGHEVNDITDSDVTLFDLSVIATATNNFSPANKLGEGGFGLVYKGQFTNGQEIAVKRLGKNSRQGMQEFKNEVILIAKLQHRNLVKTLGCCIQGEEMMLIYEFLPNKSLDKFIFDQEKRSLLDWKKRYEIILGIAKGIMYLHQDSRLRIIHRDLKASNVLLDSTMMPKISDFGMARIFGGNKVEENTNRVVGTYGYMSPEYAMEGLFSVKSDVFSFGVLLLEIISGEKSIGFYRDNSSINLIGHVWDLWKEGKALSIVDQTIISNINNKDSNDDDGLLVRCIQVGLLCVQENPNDRPSMSSVIFMLSNKTDLPQPKQAAFVCKPNDSSTKSTSGVQSSSSTNLHSINDVTVTMIEPR